VAVPHPEKADALIVQAKDHARFVRFFDFRIQALRIARSIAAPNECKSLAPSSSVTLPPLAIGQAPLSAFRHTNLRSRITWLRPQLERSVVKNTQIILASEFHYQDNTVRSARFK
jgi:hypothetical protein